MSLRPAVMPPSAVLLVRGMDDPVPGTIGANFEHNTRASAAWERAIKSQLSMLYRQAARPALEAISVQADAVLFTDYGELLASLAVDLGGSVSNSWWKNTLLQHLSVSSPGNWVQMWAEHAPHIPSALQLLHDQGRDSKVLNQVTSADTLRLLHAVALAFGMPQSTFAAIDTSVDLYSRSEARTPLSGLDDRISEQRNLNSDPLAARQSDKSVGCLRTSGNRGYDTGPLNKVGTGAPLETRSTDDNRPNDSGIASGPPWEQYITGLMPNGLGLAQRCLLGVSLLLHRAPQRASNESFVLKLQSWLAAEAERQSGSISADRRSPGGNTSEAIHIARPLIRDESSSGYSFESRDVDLRPTSHIRERQ